jgi:uncharacterized protein (TIGR03437 family)
MTALSRCALAALACILPLRAADSGCPTDTPCYSALGIVNSASYASGWLAPTTFGTIFGENLSHLTGGSEHGDLYLNGVRVLVGGLASLVTYVSPTQINFVVPSGLTATTVTVQLTREGVAGPAVALSLHDSAPALFAEPDAITAIATHPDGTLVTQESPAHPGETIVLYATGLGPYSSPVADSDIPPDTDAIKRLAEFSVLLDGRSIDRSLIYYAGSAAVWVGLYEISLQLPADAGRNPEIRIALGDRVSLPGVFLPLEPAE